MVRLNWMNGIVCAFVITALYVCKLVWPHVLMLWPALVIALIFGIGTALMGLFDTIRQEPGEIMGAGLLGFLAPSALVWAFLSRGTIRGGQDDAGIVSTIIVLFGLPAMAFTAVMTFTNWPMGAAIVCAFVMWFVQCFVASSPEYRVRPT